MGLSSSTAEEKSLMWDNGFVVLANAVALSAGGVVLLADVLLAGDVVLLADVLSAGGVVLLADVLLAGGVVLLADVMFVILLSDVLLLAVAFFPTCDPLFPARLPTTFRTPHMAHSRPTVSLRARHAL